MKAITIVLILGLIALAVILPASAAGQGGNGKMLQNGAGTAGTGICPNPDCPQGDCPYNQVPPRDGTGMQYGKGLNR
jgi:hypothetical protein